VIGYRFLPPAEEEMVEASHFYEAESSGLGDEFLDDVQRVIDSLREHPKLGQQVGRKFRLALLRRFPFSLFNSEEPDGILVVAVAHQRRRPGYWRGRAGR
jgi:plasmid stabilization system protein ParE